MDFHDLVDEVAALPQKRQQLTYRSLKRQFGLDDETLDDLKFELIKGQKRIHIFLLYELLI